MKKFDLCMRKNLKGNSMHSASMTRRAQIKSYFIKEWEIDAHLQTYFKQLHSNRTVQKMFKSLNGVYLTRVKVAPADYMMFLNFLQRKTHMSSLKFDLQNMQKSVEGISNNTMLKLLICKVLNNSFLKKLKTLDIDFCDFRLKPHLQKKLYHSLHYFRELEGYRFNIQTQEQYVPEVRTITNCFNNMVYLKKINRLYFDLATMNDLDLCKAIGSKLQKITLFQKLQIKGFLNDSSNRNPEALITLLSYVNKLHNIKTLQISTFDYSKSKSYDTVIGSIEAAVQKLAQLETLDLKADFAMKKCQFISFWDSLGQHENLTTLRLSFLTQHINPMQIHPICQNLSRLVQLKAFSFTIVGPELVLSENDLAHFAQGISSLKNLHYLKLFFPSVSKKKYDLFFDKMENLPLLNTFKFSGDQQPGKIFEFAGRHPSLENLKLILRNVNAAKLPRFDPKQNLSIKRFCLRAEGLEQDTKFLTSLLRQFKNLEKCDLRNRKMQIKLEEWMDVLEALVRAENLEKFALHSSFVGFGDEIRKALPCVGYTSRYRRLSVTAFVENSPPMTFQLKDPDLWLY